MSETFSGGDGLVKPGAEQTVLTCVYCGQAYPAGTPASGADVKVLTDHIRICEVHPMRKLEASWNG